MATVLILQLTSHSTRRSRSSVNVLKPADRLRIAPRRHRYEVHLGAAIDTGGILVPRWTPKTGH
jgi:hypothetical protein